MTRHTMPLLLFLMLTVLLGMRPTQTSQAVALASVSCPQPPTAPFCQTVEAARASLLILENNEASAVDYTLTFYDLGDTAIFSTTATLAAGSSQTDDLWSGDHVSAGWSEGTIAIQASAPLSVTVDNTPRCQPYNQRICTPADIHSRLTVMNLGTSAAAVALSFYDNVHLTPLTTITDSIPSRDIGSTYGSKRYDLADVAALPRDWHGTVVTSSDQPIEVHTIQLLTRCAESRAPVCIPVSGIVKDTTPTLQSTHYVLTNDLATTVVITQTWLDLNDQVVNASAGVQLPPLSTSDFTADLPELPEDFHGTLLIEGDGLLTAQIVGPVMQCPLTPTGSPNCTVLAMPVEANHYFVTNTTAETVTYHHAIYVHSGQLLEEREATLAPGERATYTLPTGASERWVVITASRPFEALDEQKRYLPLIVR